MIFLKLDAILDVTTHSLQRRTVANQKLNPLHTMPQ